MFVCLFFKQQKKKCFMLDFKIWAVTKWFCIINNGQRYFRVGFLSSCGKKKKKEENNNRWGLIFDIGQGKNFCKQLGWCTAGFYSHFQLN